MLDVLRNREWFKSREHNIVEEKAACKNFGWLKTMPIEIEIGYWLAAFCVGVATFYLTLPSENLSVGSAIARLALSAAVGTWWLHILCIVIIMTVAFVGGSYLFDLSQYKIY